jgi:hypothetical protein
MYGIILAFRAFVDDFYVIFVSVNKFACPTSRFVPLGAFVRFKGIITVLAVKAARNVHMYNVVI